LERRAIGGVPQQRLSNALPENPSLPARGTEHLPGLFLSTILALTRAQSARRSIERKRRAVPAHSHPCQPRHLLLDPNQGDLDRVLIFASSGLPEPAVAVVGPERRRLPVEPRGQPPYEQRRACQRTR